MGARLNTAHLSPVACRAFWSWRR